MSGVLLVTPPAPVAHGAAFATGGSGQYRGDIVWLTWGGPGNGQHGVVLNNGDTSTASIPVGGQSLETSCTLADIRTNWPSSTSSGGLHAYRPGTWSGDYFDDLYNIGGTGTSSQLVAGISNTVDARGLTFSITCRATLGGQPFELPGMVFADAEQSGLTEYVQGTGVGEFSLIERARSCGTADGRATVTQSGTSQTMRLQGFSDSCAGPTAVSYLNFADSAYSGVDRAVRMGSEIRGSGKSVIAIGIIVPFDVDVGDAPASYGRAAHVITPTASPVLGTRSSVSYWSLPQATLGLPSLRLRAGRRGRLDAHGHEHRRRPGDRRRRHR